MSAGSEGQGARVSAQKSSMAFKMTPEGEREVVMTRVFNAPRRMVFDAMTKPEDIQQWLLGPDGWTMPVCEVDFRVGGSYHWVWRHSDGREMGVSGVYREIVPPERIVHTEAFDQPWYPGEAVITTVLKEDGGRTMFQANIAYFSREVRDGALKSGMEKGVARSYERLDEVLATLH